MFQSKKRSNNAKHKTRSRNPLKSGRCFNAERIVSLTYNFCRRNPLKSGRCFNLRKSTKPKSHSFSRNPLKSGRCFNESASKVIKQYVDGRNPLKSGRCFNKENEENLFSYKYVAIPLNRVGVSIDGLYGPVVLAQSQSP